MGNDKAYRPDLNPIEAVFNQRKQALRSAKARTFATLIEAMGEALRSVSRQDIPGMVRQERLPGDAVNRDAQSRPL